MCNTGVVFSRCTSPIPDLYKTALVKFYGDVERSGELGLVRMGLRHTTRSLFLRSEGLAVARLPQGGGGGFLSLQGTSTACISSCHFCLAYSVHGSTARPHAPHGAIIVISWWLALLQAQLGTKQTMQCSRTTCPFWTESHVRKQNGEWPSWLNAVISDALVAWHGTTVLTDLWRINVLASLANWRAM